MSDEHSDDGQANPTSASASDSFEALLKQAARASVPASSSRSALLSGGTTLSNGRLSIVRRLGQGGMGVVYEAFDAQRKSRVALKTLTRMDAGSVYRLKNEFRALADVRHDNLVALHELWNDGGLWCFSMELVEGEHFDAWVRPRAADIERTRALDESRLRAALPQLIEAVSAIHDAGKLHRDLKPSNVLVTPEGRVVVLDFGLAIEPEIGGVGQTVADDNVSGTPAYMAPEQAAGAAAVAASDLYALGVMLFEALTGKLPFEGRTGEMIAAKQRDAAPRASRWNAHAPADLDDLCAELLARDPRARPDVAALRARLPAADSRSDNGTPRSSRSASGERSASAVADAAPELLGREAELGALRDAFAATLDGKPVVLFVSGESGMGKSALCEAFLHELRTQARATVLAGRCYERENVPFKGFDSLVDDLSRYLRRLSGQEAAAVLPREAYAIARVFPVLERVAAVAEAPKKVIPDPQELKRRAFDAFAEMMMRMRDRAPLVVVLDDVQWLDQDSTRFMQHLFVQPQLVPALLVCAHRSEGAAENPLLQAVIRAARDRPELDVRTLAVGPLAEAALRTLSRRWLPPDTEDATLTALSREAQGSPFFAAEIARAAAIAGVAPGARTPSLSAALALHVQSLPLGAQRLLALLALAGQPLPPELVAEAANVQDGHVLIDRLRAEQLVRTSFDAHGARRVECYHDKIREQLTTSLDALESRELALGLSRALLAHADAYAELLARTFELAGLPEEAAQHAARAAEQAQAALAFDRAAALYAQALARGRFEPARLHALRVSRADALTRAGQGELAAEAYLEAAQGAPKEIERELTRKAAENYLYCGNLVRGRELFGQFLRENGISMPQSFAGAIASVVWSRARLRLRGLAFRPRTEWSAATLRELDVLHAATHCFIRTDQVRAADFSARWVRRALEAGHPLHAALALSRELLILSFGAPNDPHTEAIRQLGERLCAETGDVTAKEWLHFYRSWLFLTRSQPELALSDIDAALELDAANPSPSSAYDRAWMHYFRATHLFQLGRMRESTDLALAQLSDAGARSDQTVALPLAVTAAMGLLAFDRPRQAAELLDRFPAPASDQEVTVQDLMWISGRMLVAAYDGTAREFWIAQAARRDQVLASAYGRIIMRGFAEAMFAGSACAAAIETEDATERAQLRREAARLARRGSDAEAGLAMLPNAALSAYLRGDREGAIKALRARLSSSPMPFMRGMMELRLGALIGGDEGAAMMANAETALRSYGIVNPARFTSALMPGAELA